MPMVLFSFVSGSSCHVPAPRSPRKDERVGSPTAQMNDPTQPSAACRHRSLSPCCSNAEKNDGWSGGALRSLQIFESINACITKIYDPNESIRRKQNFSSANRYPLCSRLSQPPHHGLIRIARAPTESDTTTPNKQRSETRPSAALPPNG